MISEDIIARIGIAFLGLCGFLVARHIYKEKRADRPLICPMHFDCNAVVSSDYSKFFGIPLEIFGMVYYACVFIGYIFLSFLSEVLPNMLVSSLVLVSIAAFLFSVYLIFVQSFILKKFCTWCLVSAGICVIIFALTLVAYDFSSLTGIYIK